MRLLTLTPWRRGPLLLASRPGVAVALFAAALVAALPTAAAPLFLSSAEHATLHRQINQTCDWQVGAQFTGEAAPAIPFTFDPVLGADDVVGAQRYRQRHEAVAAHQVDGLTDPVSTGYADANAELIDRPLPYPDLRGLRLLARPDATEHVEVIAGPAGAGLWLPHEHAQRQGIEVGDELTLTSRSPEPGVWELTGPGRVAPAPEPVTLPVAAIYRDLRTTPTTGYWCGVEHAYAGTPAQRADPDAVILPTALIDTDTLLSVGERTQLVLTQVVELAVADPRLTAPAAATIASDIETLRTAMFTGHPELFPAGSADDTEFSSSLDRFQRRAELVRTGLLPPVLPITAAGTLVGLAVAAAAAVFWVQRRRRELAVLAAHGVGTGALGLKAAVEALPAVVAGTAAGWAAAWLLVTGVGPSPVLAPGTLPAAGATAAGVGLVASLLIGGLAANRARGLTDTRPVTHRVGWWRRLPWELALVAAAPVAWLLLAGAEVTDPGAGGVGSVAHVPARLLVTPILAVTGGSIFGARLAARWLHRRGPRRTPAGPARLLAWRRAARTAAATATLAAATAVPVAMAAFGATATDSIRTTADAELQYSLGSDTVLSYPRPFERELDDLPPPPPVPAALADRSTEVLRLNQQQLDGLIVDVLAVDPDSFPTGAFWDDRIPGDSLRDATARLTAGSPATIVASRRITPGPATLHIRHEQVPVEVAATRPLPGAQAAYPMVLVHRDLVGQALSERTQQSFTPQLWISGKPRQSLATIADAELPMSRVVTIDDHRGGAVHEPVTYTFQYLIALSGFTGLIGAVGLLLYLESRTGTHRRGYVMLRRLGLAAAAHRRALLLEVGAPVLAGLLAGVGGALAVAYGLHGGFDINPRRFPDALLVLPTTMAVAVGGAALAIAAGASLLAHARIRRADPAEVLRDTA